MPHPCTIWETLTNSTTPTGLPHLRSLFLLCTSQDVLTLHLHDFPSSMFGLELYFPNSQSIRCAPILTAKYSLTWTNWYYTVLNFLCIIPTHNRVRGLGQSCECVLKCYFLCVKVPRGGRQGLSHFLFPPLCVEQMTCKLITVFSAHCMLKLHQCFADQFG